MRTASAEDATRVRALVLAGDVRAAATLALELVGPEMLRYLRLALRDEEDARDAFSELAEALWRALPSFRWEASLRTWAYRLAWSAARRVTDDAWRRLGRRLASGEASLIAAEIRSRPTAERLDLRRAALERLVATLSLEERALFALRVGQGLSWAEVAAVLTEGGAAVDEATVARRFSRLKARLGKLAKDEGILD
jgi:RNA polymerase sigma-70 factor, ECF subfamily